MGLAFRLIPARYAATALSSVGSRAAADAATCAANSRSPVTALREVEALVETDRGLLGVKGPPRILLSIEYDLQAVVDLTESTVQHALGTSVAELCAPWRALNAAGVPAPTQVLGGVVHDLSSIEALRVPSARDQSADNLVISPGRLHLSSMVRVFDDSGLIDARLP